MAIRYQSNLNRVLRELDDAKEITLTAVGEFVDGQARLNAPVGQYTDGRVGGNLRDSHDYRVDARNDKVMIGNSAEYSLWVHEGTSKSRANPWLENSIMSNVSRIKSLIQQYYKGNVR